MTDGGVASGELYRPQRRHTLERLVSRDQHFAAPRRAVSPIASAIEGHADDRPGKAVFRHGAGDMRVMMLNANLQWLGPRLGIHASTCSPDADRAR